MNSFEYSALISKAVPVLHSITLTHLTINYLKNVHLPLLTPQPYS